MPLIEYIFSFSIAWIIAAYIFFNFGDRLRAKLSVVLIGAAIGGIFAGVIGHGVAYSPLVDMFMSFFDLQDSLPEPFISIGFIIGAIVFVIFVSSFSSTPEETSTPSTLFLALQFSAAAFAGRVVVSILRAVVYAFAFFIYDYLFLAMVSINIIGGFVFGVLTWYLCTRRKAG